jgi:hypothetical protein
VLHGVSKYKSLHVSGIFSAHHQEFYTVHSALGSSRVQWKTPDDGQRRCPKHVEFYNRINLDN